MSSDICAACRPPQFIAIELMRRGNLTCGGATYNITHYQTTRLSLMRRKPITSAASFAFAFSYLTTCRLQLVTTQVYFWLTRQTLS